MNSSAREDAFTFYGMSVVSLLESAVPNYVDNLQPYYGDCSETARWLQETWLPEESAHGRMTREFVERQWPEFEWQKAYQAFLLLYVPRCNHQLLRPSKSLEALARCVTETEAAMVYRCLAEYSCDPQLKSMLQEMSRDEIRHYTYFRDLFDKHDAIERNSFWRKAQTVLARSELVRNEDLALAFEPLNQPWSGAKPFAPLTYAAFLSQASQVMSRHFPVEAAKRMLFRPLLRGHAWEAVAVRALAFLVRKQYAIEA
jgi:hypothetical protein